jgi:hypothetical protein
MNTLCLLVFISIFGIACSVRNVQQATPVNSTSANLRTYSAPDNAFTIKLPGNWKLQRDETDLGYLTVIQDHAANISILTANNRLPEFETDEKKSYLLVESSKPFFEGWIGGLEKQAHIKGTGRIYATQFSGLEALRSDVTYYRDDADDPRLGYSLFLFGHQNMFFISVTGSRSRFKDLENIISTIRIEP